jgi:hypothetical protein
LKARLFAYLKFIADFECNTGNTWNSIEKQELRTKKVQRRDKNQDERTEIEWKAANQQIIQCKIDFIAQFHKILFNYISNLERRLSVSL